MIKGLIEKVEALQKEARDGMKRASGESDPYLYQYMVGKFHAFGKVAGILKKLSSKKEQKPIEPSDDELQRHQDELYNFKVFAAKQAKEHHISFVHDFEWNNFCAELLSYFNEKRKPAEWDELQSEFKNINEAFENGKKEVVAHPEKYGLCKSVEWSEEDEEIFNNIIEKAKGGHWIEVNEIIWLITRFKSLRPVSKESLQPHWKPSEEQMKALDKAIPVCMGVVGRDEVAPLESLYNDLKKL